ncbi:Hypothetical Protein FCC1311_083152 [Hondaea fermentalgiana]|uniref:Choloylglycine hydrolase/NAAA C-terminal domain-containing protein n=1 Tax=Hondaea fermentalgiana TaxID=2315210 RepID=A0A2R5GMI4_9STRA|nr:Hypothetical Protein FCC1311_083152 [Hondaea fermentalgiana]|eukprot:GBG32090.1 Hypothetical Protein FCC1311_083152 [Hondaea fermentalgiana]
MKAASWWLAAVALWAAVAGGGACTYVEVRYGKGDEDFLIGRTMELGGLSLEKGWKMTAFRRGVRFPYSLLPIKVMEPIVENMEPVEALATSRRRLRAANRQPATADAVLKSPVSENVERKRHFHTSIGFLASTGSLQMLGFELEAIVDGMNEAGLTMSAHTHMRAQYAQDTPAAENAAVHVDYLVLIPWVLGRFNSTSAVVDALTSGEVAVVGHVLLPKQLSIHFALADAHGHSVVLEWVKGSLRVHENSVGVLTNDPEFDWHLLNLNRFSSISPQSSGWGDTIGLIETEEGPVPVPGNHGLNLVGLPGDAGPETRFVRTFVLRELAMYNAPVTTRREAFQLTTGLLNNVFIPNGVAAKLSFTDVGDFTQWALIKDPKARRTFYRSYNDNSWKMIDMARLDDFFRSADGDEKLALHVFTDSDGVEDVTKNLSV